MRVQTSAPLLRRFVLMRPTLPLLPERCTRLPRLLSLAPLLALACTFPARAETTSTTTLPARVSPATLPAAVVDATQTSAIPAIGRGAFPAWLAPVSQLPSFLDLRLAYDYRHVDAVQARPGEQESTSIHTFSPAASLSLGDRWRLDYEPSWTWYSNDRFHSATEQRAQLEGSVTVATWDYALYQSYAHTSAPLAETARQTELDSYVTRIGVARELHSGLLLQAGLLQQLRFSEGFTDTKEWSVPLWVYLQLSDILQAGVGVTGGYVSVDPGADMTYDRWQVQLGGRVAQKILWQVNAGLENRHVRSSAQGTLHNPVYGGSLTWQPTDTTGITLAGRHQVGRTLLRDLISKRDEFSAQLTQRLLERYWLALRYTHYNIHYIATGQSGAATPLFAGSDAYSLSLGTTLFNRTDVAATYSYSRSRWLVGSDYHSNEYGLQLRHAF